MVGNLCDSALELLQSGPSSGRGVFGDERPLAGARALAQLAAAHKGVAPVLAARADFQAPERDPNAPSPQAQAAAAQVRRPMDQPPPPPHLSPLPPR